MINSVVAYSVSRSILSAFQVFLVSIFVIHFSSLSNWGSFVQIYLIAALCVLIINSGSKDYLIKTISHTPALMWEHLSANTYYRLLLNLFIPLIIFGFLPFEPLLGAGIVGMVLMRTLLSSYEAIIIYQKAFKRCFYIDIASLTLLCIVIICGHYYAGLNSSFLIYCFVLADLVKLVFYDYAFGFFRHLTFVRKTVTQQLTATAPFLLSGIIGFLINKADLYLFSALIKDPQLVAKYHILNTLSNMLVIVISALVQVRNKEIFRLPLHKLQTLINTYLKLGFGLCAFILTTFYLVAPVIFGFTPQPLHLLLIASSVMAFTVYMFYIQLQYRMNKVHLVNLIIGISGTIGVIIGLWLIPYYEITGALIATFIANCFVLIGLWRYSSKWLNSEGVTPV